MRKPTCPRTLSRFSEMYFFIQSNSPTGSFANMWLKGEPVLKSDQRPF